MEDGRQQNVGPAEIAIAAVVVLVGGAIAYAYADPGDPTPGAESSGMSSFWWWVIGAVVLAVIVQVGKASALAKAKEAYQAALGDLSNNPESNEKRVAALEAGRSFARAARDSAGEKGVAIFDEVALQNDLSARLGKGAGAAPPPTAVVPANASRLDQLTRLSDLRDKGALTAEEFETEKRKILAG